MLNARQYTWLSFIVLFTFIAFAGGVVDDSYYFIPWTVAAIFFSFGLLFDVLFTAESSFVFDRKFCRHFLHKMKLISHHSCSPLETPSQRTTITGSAELTASAFSFLNFAIWKLLYMSIFSWGEDWLHVCFPFKTLLSRANIQVLVFDDSPASRVCDKGTL